MVTIQVMSGRIDEFVAATVANATSSRNEPGVIRFDVLQDQSAPEHVTLIEVYRDAAAVAAHKETPHYERWRDTVADMMAAPRSSQKFTPIDPVDEASWSAHR